MQDRNRNESVAWMRIQGWLAALTLTLAIVGASSVEAQMLIGPSRRLPGGPVAAEAIHARFVFSMGQRIIVVNEANEVFFHRVRNNRVDPAIRMRGRTIGINNASPRWILPRGNDIYFVTTTGETYRQEIRSETVGAPMLIPGTPVGTAGQEPAFMFFAGNRLINVTRSGEVWAYAISRQVGVARRLGSHGFAAMHRSVRHAFHVAGSIYLVTDQGEVYAYTLGRGWRPRLVRAAITDLGSNDTRWLVPLGRRLIAVNRLGDCRWHDISRLFQPPPNAQQAPAGAAPAAAPPPG